MLRWRHHTLRSPSSSQPVTLPRRSGRHAGAMSFASCSRRLSRGRGFVFRVMKLPSCRVRVRMRPPCRSRKYVRTNTPSRPGKEAPQARHACARSDVSGAASLDHLIQRLAVPFDPGGAPRDYRTAKSTGGARGGGRTFHCRDFSDDLRLFRQLFLSRSGSSEF